MPTANIASHAISDSFKKHSPTLWLWALAIGLLLGIWFITLSQLAEARSKYLQSAEKDARSLTRIFQEHTVRTLHSAEQITVFLEYLYQQQGPEIDVNGLLQMGLDKNIFQDITLYDLQGYPLSVSSGNWKYNWNPQEHISALLSGSSHGIYVSKPIYDPGREKWAMYILRKIHGENGQDDAVVSVSMDPFYFVRLYKSVMYSPHAIVSLNGTDGIIRARISNNQPSLGQDITQTWLYKKMVGKEGSVRGKSVVDGRERLFSYRIIDNYPLSVIVGLDVEGVLIPFEAMKRQRINVAIIISLVIVFFVLIISVLNRRLILGRENALSASQAKTQFLSTMSHELRTPLNGILGYAELLTEYLPKGELHAFAKSIHESGLHLLSLVNAILQLNKIAAGHIELSLEEVNVRKIVGQAVSAHAVTAAAKGLEMTSQIEHDVPEHTLCDRVKLLQVLNNLINNAVKFTDNGYVKISVSAKEGKIVFGITDTGRGIPIEVQPDIFNKFFQVSEAKNISNQGTGLGLAIVKELVHLMGGTVSLVSKPGHGSTFTFAIPYVETSQKSSPLLRTPMEEK